jgi:uncharacterized delta-60 repeat protein
MLAALLALVSSGCFGESDEDAQGRRTFEPARILVRPNGTVLLLGIGQLRGEGFRCGGEQPVIAEFMAVPVDPSGRIVGRSAVPQKTFDDWCAEEVWDAVLLADGAFAVGGSIGGPTSETGADRGFVAIKFASDGSVVEAVGVTHPTVQLASWLRPRARSLETHPPEFRGLARRPNGGVVLGRYDEGGFAYMLYSLGRDGRPDRRFGRRGAVTVQFASGNATTVEFGDIETHETGIHVFADYAPFDEGTNYQYLVFRHRMDGRLDPAFGRRGRVLLNPRRSRYEVVTEIALQEDGRVLAVGQLDAGRTRRVFVTRRDASGAVDPSWGDGGIVMRDLGRLRKDDNVYADKRAAIGVLPDGKVLVAASIAGRPTKVFRFLKDGRADTNFGRGGTLILPRL